MLTPNLALAAVFAVGLCASCGSSGLKPSDASGSGGNASATAGQSGVAGAAGVAGVAGTAGQPGAAGEVHDAAVADVATAETPPAPDGNNQPEAGAAGAGGMVGGTAGIGPLGGDNDVRKVVPTPGCGLTAPSDLVPGTLVKQMIMTKGTKDANCADAMCGSWTDDREYWVKLPTTYDKSKAFPLVIEGPGCGGHGNNLFSIPTFDSTVIRVGLTPSAVWQVVHATNPGQGCFDEKEGDDSVDFAFYETLYDKLAAQLCFDRNRVFAAGQSSGAWLANELGCKYAGDVTRPIRGVMVHSGGLPALPMYLPTCTKKPIAGIWIHQVSDQTNPFTGNIFAMNRALTVNGCTPTGVTYSTASFDPFPIGGTNSTSCKKYQGCAALSPLVVCPLPGNSNSSDSNVVVPAWATFVNMFEQPPLETP
jgi:polyhydroxybutyrate depolymerase